MMTMAEILQRWADAAARNAGTYRLSGPQVEHPIPEAEGIALLRRFPKVRPVREALARLDAHFDVPTTALGIALFVALLATAVGGR